MAEKTVRAAVDVVISKGDSNVLLVKRKNEPFSGKWALPGGMVDYGETVEQAAIREAKEETGLDVELEGLLGVYSDPERDPRGQVISIVFAASEKGGKLKNKTKETDDAMWALLTKTDGIQLAFDHAAIIEDFKIIKMMEKEQQGQ